MIRRAIAAVLAAFLLGAAAGAAAQSFKPFVVKDIRAEGLQRTEPGTVFSYLPVKVGETMNEEKAQQALRALYATGFFTDVRLEVENDVLVVYVRERPAIAQIECSGIKEFENEQLRKALRELGMAEARIFDRSMLDLAEQEIKRQYLSHGYYAAAVQTTVTPLERNRVGINITVTEGEVAKIGGINIVGAQAFPDRLGNEGYAFANTNAIPNLDKEKRSVAFNIVIDPGRRVYVRRIEVAGNTKTRDEVIRREMRQLEGAYYDASKIQLSRRRIERTGYFTEATVETRPPEASTDQADVLYSVKESTAGALLVGVGCSSVEKLAFSTSIQQSNAFGTGKFIAATINSGSVNKVYSLSYLDPYYTIDGVSQGFDVYKRRTDASNLTVAPYVTDSIGGGVKFGYPTSEVTAIDFGVNFESVNLQTFDTSPLQYLNFVSQFGNTYRYGGASAGWTRDTRDNILQPKSGALSRVSGEIAGGDLQYYRLGFQQQWLHPLTPDYTIFLRGDLGYAAGLGGKPLPFFKAYFLGGPDSVRGYAGFSLAPQVINGNAVGGNRRINGTAEFQFPMPGATREQSLRLGLFLDAGQVYAQGQKLALADLRYSTGLGLQWISPFGPLRFSIATPHRSRA